MTNLIYEYPQPVKIRPIYHVKKLPFIARAYRLAYDFRSLSPPYLFQTNRKMFSRIVRWLFQSKFGERQGQFTVQTQQGIRRCDMNIDNRQFHSIYFRRFQSGYEPEVCALIDIFIENTNIKTFYDIGANWGYFSGYVASHPLFRGKIWAFEPQETVFKDLTKFIQQGKLEEFIQCHQLALSNREGLGHIELPDGFHSGLGQLHPDGSIPIKKLDSLNLPPPDLIKIDVESHEYHVISGGIQILTQHRPYLIFESLSTDNPNSQKIFSELFSIQYNCFEINSPPLSYDPESRVLTLIPITGSLKYNQKRNIFACPNNKNPPIGFKNFMDFFVNSRDNFKIKTSK